MIAEIGICIPTYNRADLLEKTLDLSINSMRDFNVPIYISDNDSSDETGNRIKRAKTKYPYIFYQKNTLNIGADRNFEKVLKMCSREFCWLLGDDDYISDGFSLLYSKILQFDADAYIITDNHNFVEGIYAIDEIFPAVISETLGMSFLIMSKKIIAEGKFDNYVGTNFIHAGVLLDYLLIHPTAKVGILINNDYVSQYRPGYCEFENRAIQVMVINTASMIEKLPLNSKEIDAVRNEFIKQMLSWRGGMSPMVLMSLREKKAINYQQIIEYRDELKRYGLMKYYLILLISKLPVKLLSICRSVLEIFRKRTKMYE